jgi:integrase
VDTGGCREFILGEREHKTGRKTGHARHIFLPDDVAAFVEARLREISKDGPILVNCRGNPWTHEVAIKLFRKVRKKLKLRPTISLYAFRHTFATRHLLAGVPITRVATWLGNSVQMVEKSYWHPLEVARGTLLEGLDADWRGGLRSGA